MTGYILILASWNEYDKVYVSPAPVWLAVAICTRLRQVTFFVCAFYAGLGKYHQLQIGLALKHV